MKQQALLSLGLLVASAIPAASQTSQTELTQSAEGYPVSVVRLHATGDWPWPIAADLPRLVVGETAGQDGAQQISPGWIDGSAAAADQNLSARRLFGFLGGAAIGFFGLEALSQDNEPGSFGNVALVGVGLVGLSVLWTGSSAPPVEIMDELAVRPADYREAFLSGYSTRLASRRMRTGLVGAGLGLGVGVAVLAVAVSAWCNSGDC